MELKPAKQFPDESNWHLLLYKLGWIYADKLESINMARYKRCRWSTWAFSLLSHEFVWYGHYFGVYSKMNIRSHQTVESVSLMKCLSGKKNYRTNMLDEGRFKIRKFQVCLASYLSIVQQGDAGSVFRGFRINFYPFYLSTCLQLLFLILTIDIRR